MDLVSNFLPIKTYEHGRVKNKLIVSGKMKNEFGTVVEEIINIVLNRFEDKFNLEKLRLAPHLQISERKEGLTLVATTRFDQIKNLVDFYQNKNPRDEIAISLYIIFPVRSHEYNIASGSTLFA